MAGDLDRISTAILENPIDPNVHAALPAVEAILHKEGTSGSAWARGFRVDVLHTDGSEESYFMKVSVGDHGREALKGEFEATSAIFAITPDFCPKPIAWGSMRTQPNAHFYLCKFYNFEFDEIPEPEPFCQRLAALHSSHSSPNGKFGFHCTTYNGNLPQDNTWSDSWESFFDRSLRHVLRVREERAGPDAELDAWLPALFDKVIPRLLRPLESNGRKIQPSLVHGDLWYGNAAVDRDTRAPIVFDPSSFWAHSEYEFGNWRPIRNGFHIAYLDAYHAHVPKSAPTEDFDDRNALYALRFDLHAATLFPENDEYLKSVIEEIKRLAEKFPEGYVVENDRTGNIPSGEVEASVPVGGWRLLRWIYTALEVMMHRYSPWSPGGS